MAKSPSPLRYPGGKSKIYEKVKNIIISNDYGDRTYVEPFAGGFGVGIGLLCEKIVPSVILNDFDSHIYNFWYSVLHDTDNLLCLISDTPITLEEREKQKQNYHDVDADPLTDGFATLFLNRVNFSGVIKGGPIGGLDQSGLYKIDCRFNKEDVKKKIEKIASLRKKIKLYNRDAVYFIKMHLMKMKLPLFLNIDPPYVVKGNQLYTNYFTENDHRHLHKVIVEHLNKKYPWIITYDDTPLIRELYTNFHIQEYAITHSAGGTVFGKELVITNLSLGNFTW
ncbi:MAG: DNA adenine methylase [Chitinispirillales bacterium]|jgi:DNA adenine methylase|nr:DNA adenine methylase [Chitinispirillales bacterium]